MALFFWIVSMEFLFRFPFFLRSTLQFFDLKLFLILTLKSFERFWGFSFCQKMVLKIDYFVRLWSDFKNFWGSLFELIVKIEFLCNFKSISEVFVRNWSKKWIFSIFLFWYLQLKAFQDFSNRNRWRKYTIWISLMQGKILRVFTREETQNKVYL